jgi:catechol 2,3-dioxygenase-like lactoylglutathione lyase family enzyme
MAVMTVGVQVSFDASDPARLGAFWAELLGYVEQPPPEGFGSWQEALVAFGVPEDQRDSAYAIVDPAGAGPRLFFQRVPEAKVAKNRVHLDVNVGAGRTADERPAHVRAEAARAVALGATQVRVAEQRGEFWVVLQDPDGNEFCLQ